MQRVGLKWDVVPLVVATLLIVALELVIPVTVRQVYDTFIPHQSLDSLNVLMTAAVGFLLVDAFLRWARANLQAWQGARRAHAAGTRMIDALLQGNVAPSRNNIGGKLALINLVRGYHAGGGGSLAVTLAELTMIPLMLVLIALIAGKLALVSLTLIAVFCVVMVVAGRSLRDARDARRAEDAVRLDMMVETLGAAQSIKALSAERVMAARHAGLKYTSARWQFEVGRFQTLVFDITQIFGTVMILAVVFVGAGMVLDKDLTVGALLAAIILSGRSVVPMQKALGALHRSQAQRSERKQVEALLATPASATVTTVSAALPENEGKLALHGVRIMEAEGEAPLLDTVDFAFPARQFSLLDGLDHAQAMTVFKTLSGLQRPERGAVRLNDADLLQLPEACRAQQIAYLQAETVLYRGTILENLTRFGQVKMSDAQFVMRQLRLDEDLNVLPRGLQTVLRGDGGDPVPPGLRERIALARSLAPRPRVILFNHADSGLDRRSYTALYELLAKLRGHATIIMASDDETLRSLAQHCFVCEGGGLRANEGVCPPSRPQTRYRELRL
ncbi:ABC-type bacteriocin/lantibiotic exporter with double-glycine peptidase domain [Rhodobacter sp. JA431]|nr:ABC-type bacteriocin/lantibiotic exporter with double-glycine peptidase domain [Rhodobacter sp. JA431]